MPSWLNKILHRKRDAVEGLRRNDGMFNIEVGIEANNSNIAKFQKVSMARATNPPPISPQLTVSTSDSLQFLLFHASPSSVDGAAIKEISENSETLLSSNKNPFHRHKHMMASIKTSRKISIAKPSDPPPAYNGIFHKPLKTKPKKSAKELKVLPGCEPEVVQEALGKFSTSYNLDTNGHVLLETPSQNQKE